MYPIIRYFSLLFLICLIVNKNIAFATTAHAIDQSTPSKSNQLQTPIQVKFIQGIHHPDHQIEQHHQSIRLSALIFNQIKVNSTTNHTKARSQSIFWPASGLFIDSEDIKKNKDAILRDLNQLAMIWQQNERQYHSVLSLITYLKNSTFQQRIFTPIDENLFLLDAIPNPLIQENILILLPPRPSNITLLGAIVQTQQLSHQPIFSSADYYQAVTQLKTFGLDQVSVIQPNGRLRQDGIAYWNQEKHPLIPGSHLYVPYLNLPPQFAHLNHSIPQLLQHRVL